MTQTTLFATPEKTREVHPYIISVSRATDIPAFYMDWFFDRWKHGYILWRSPYNQTFTQKVWFDNVHAVIFWTKDPQALYQYIQKLNTCPFLYYVQITLNDYEPELEPGVPPLHDRVNAFQNISQNLGTHRVIWRYDPLLLSDTISLSTLCSRIEKLCKNLAGYTEKLIVSFIQIAKYKGVRRLLSTSSHNGIREFTLDEKIHFLAFLSKIEEKYQIKTHLCCEEQDSIVYAHTRPGDCVDRKLLLRLAQENNEKNSEFISFLEMAKKDPGQRKKCSCIHAKDIGQYSSCLHFCRYCYANGSDIIVKSRYKAHNYAKSINQDLPFLIP